MTNVADFYDIWLKPDSLPAGKTVPVTITKVEAKEVHPQPTQTKRKLVLSFKGKQRRLILNGGNANRMTTIGGEDYTAWVGLVIGLQRKPYTSKQETIIIVPVTGENGNEK